MEKNYIEHKYIYKNEEYVIYYDLLYEKIWISKNELERLINKSNIYISRAISHLIIDEVIDTNKSIRKIKTGNNTYIYLYDLSILKEILPQRIYNNLTSWAKKVIEKYEIEHKKIFIINGELKINNYLINNILDINLNKNEVSNLLNINIDELNKTNYDIFNLIDLIYLKDTSTTNMIKKYFSNILIRCLKDGYYINNNECKNNKTKLINITKIADNLLLKEKLDDIEKEKYYKNTISYNDELYESYSFIKKLIKSAHEKIIIISKYMDDEVFSILKLANTKIELYSSVNNLITKYNLKNFMKYHSVNIYNKYIYNDTFIIIDDLVYYFDISIINILKNNSICIKENISIIDLFKKLKLQKKA